MQGSAQRREAQQQCEELCNETMPAVPQDQEGPSTVQDGRLELSLGSGGKKEEQPGGHGDKDGDEVGGRKCSWRGLFPSCSP